MGTRGKWGITRDQDGTLANIFDWPWYWRYGAGLAIVVSALAAAYLFAGPASTPGFWVLVGVGALFALMIMHELGGLLLFVALIGGVWLATDILIPDFELSSPTQVGLAGALVIGYLGHQVMQMLKAQQKAIDNTWLRLTDIEDSRKAQSADIYRQLASLEAKLAELEASRRDNFREAP